MTVFAASRALGRTSYGSVKARVYEGFLAVSALATLGIGVRSQLSFDDFEPIGYGPAQQQRVQAYAEVVRDTEAMASKPYRFVKPEAARSIALRWIHGQQTGELKPLEPTSFEDDINVPVKTEILRADTGLSVYLNELAMKEQDAGRWWQSAQDALLSYRVADVIKYSDFDAIGQLGLTQRRSLTTIGDAMARLTHSQRRQIADRMLDLHKNRVPLSRLALLGRIQYLDYLRRQQIPVPNKTIDAPAQYYDSIRPTEKEIVVVRGFKLGRLADNPIGREFFTAMEFGYKSEASVWADEAAVLKQVDHPVMRIVKRSIVSKRVAPMYGPYVYGPPPFYPGMRERFMAMQMHAVAPPPSIAP